MIIIIRFATPTDLSLKHGQISDMMPAAFPTFIHKFRTILFLKASPAPGACLLSSAKSHIAEVGNHSSPHSEAIWSISSIMLGAGKERPLIDQCGRVSCASTKTLARICRNL